MQFSIYDAFYSQLSHQHVSAGIPAIVRVTLLYKNRKLQEWLNVSPSLHKNSNCNFGSKLVE